MHDAVPGTVAQIRFWIGFWVGLGWVARLGPEHARCGSRGGCANRCEDAGMGADAQIFVLGGGMDLSMHNAGRFLGWVGLLGFGMRAAIKGEGLRKPL